MKILVTGATGFIGRHLVEDLLSRGEDVTALVRKTSKVDLLKEEEVPLVYADITDGQSVKKVLETLKPDVVFHCAALVMSRDEKKLYSANVEGTRNICRAAFGNGVEKFIYVSSVAVISGNDETPLTDDMSYSATNAYGRSKVEAERVVVEFRDKGLRTAIIRPCIVYGEDEPHAFGRILENVAKRRVPLPDISGINAKVQLVYVGNVVALMELALEKEDALTGTFISADKEILTMKELLEMFYKETDAGTPPIIPGWAMKMAMIIPPVRKKVDYFFRDRIFDISRATHVLGFTPAISVQEGVRRMVKCWKQKRLH